MQRENERLDAWMVLEGYDYKGLAERLGFDPSYVWYIRAGHRPVTESFRWRFAAEFGFELAAKLFGGDSDPKAVALAVNGS